MLGDRKYIGDSDDLREFFARDHEIDDGVHWKNMLQASIYHSSPLTDRRRPPACDEHTEDGKRCAIRLPHESVGLGPKRFVWPVSADGNLPSRARESENPYRTSIYRSSP